MEGMVELDLEAPGQEWCCGEGAMEWRMLLPVI
jgi:hypothetical protein